MRTEYYYDSCGAGQIHVCRWTPSETPVAVLQIVHGISEYAERYDDFANDMNQLGYLVVAEDHMGHGKTTNGIKGYFHGGWMAAVADTEALLDATRKEFPELPYVLLGHSMGSFMVRSILCKYPNNGISAAILCGTAWQPRKLLPAAVKFCEAVCKTSGEEKPHAFLKTLVFGSYNRKVEHPRTDMDWLTRDETCVDQYIADPLCSFMPTAGLIRDMLKGLLYTEIPKNIDSMRKDLPVLFLAGGDDPVGSYGKGVMQAANAFRKIGMKDVSCKIYPLGRHEILNEINKKEVYRDISAWLENRLRKNL